MHYRSLVVRVVAVAAPILSVAVFACSSDPATTPAGSTSGEPAKELPNSGIAQNEGTSSTSSSGTSGTSGGTSGTSGNPGGPTITLAAYATASSNSFCDYWQRCFPTIITNQYGSLADCKTRMAQVANGAWLADAKFDEAAVNAAVACTTAATCDEKYGGKWQVKCEFPKPTNLIADNAKCGKAEHCASGNCFGLTAGACGTCKPAISVGVGITCGGDAVCQKGLQCAGKCVQARGLAETCNSDTLLCGAGLTCNTTSGVCEKGGVVSTPCATASCDIFELATCRSSTDTCVALTFAALDQPCGRFGEGAECDAGLYCKVPVNDAGPSSDIGVCKPRVADGQPCTQSRECRELANCRNNVCVLAGSDRPVCP